MTILDWVQSPWVWGYLGIPIAGLIFIALAERRDRRKK